MRTRTSGASGTSATSRWAYFQCEYAALRGQLTPELVGSADTATATPLQQARVAELGAALHDHGTPGWASGLDTAIAAHRAARSYARAIELADEVFAAAPTPARATQFGWAVIEGQPVPASIAARAAGASVLDVVGRALDAVDGALSAGRMTDTELTDSVRLMVALKVLKINWQAADTVAAGAEALAWALADAVLEPSESYGQLTAEWLLRQFTAVPGAACALAEYAATVAAESEHESVLETRFLALSKLLGPSPRTEPLLAELLTLWDSAPEDDERREWATTLRLDDAVQRGDLAALAQMLSSGLDGGRWGAMHRSIATVMVHGLHQAQPVAASALKILTDATANGREEPRLQAYLAAILGDHDEAARQIDAARASGNTVTAVLDDDAAGLSYLAGADDRSPAEYVADRIGHALSGEDVRIWQHLVYRWAVQVRPGFGDRGDEAVLAAAAEKRIDELVARQEHWPEDLRRVSPAASFLAAVWLATIAQDPNRLLDALASAPGDARPASLRRVLAHVRDRSYAAMAQWLLPGEPPAQRLERRMAIALGERFIPEDTGPAWVLFARLIPEMRARVEADIGFTVPSVNVRGSWSSRPDIVEFLIDEVTIEQHVVPTEGMFVLDDAPAASDGALADPLTGAAVRQVGADDPGPADGRPRYTPLEFAMRYAERFVRRHFAELVTTWSVRWLVDAAGAPWDAQISDPATYRAWLAGLREDPHLGGARTAEERAAALAQRTTTSRLVP